MLVGIKSIGELPISFSIPKLTEKECEDTFDEKNVGKNLYRLVIRTCKSKKFCRMDSDETDKIAMSFPAFDKLACMNVAYAHIIIIRTNDHQILLWDKLPSTDWVRRDFDRFV